MKNTRMLVVVLLLIATTFTGCNKIISPDEMAKILYAFYIQEDQTNLEALNMTVEEANAITEQGVSNYERELKEGLQALGGEGVVIDDDAVSKAIAARRQLEKKLHATIEIISQDKNICEMKIESTYFDEEAIFTQASTALAEQMAEVELEDEESFIQQCVNIYAKEIINAYENAEVSVLTNEMNVTFEKQDNMWLPAHQQAFIDKLTEITSSKCDN